LNHRRRRVTSPRREEVALPPYSRRLRGTAQQQAPHATPSDGRGREGWHEVPGFYSVFDHPPASLSDPDAPNRSPIGLDGPLLRCCQSGAEETG